jgi:hypothetical protein
LKYNSATKRNTVLTHGTTKMNPENAVLSGKSQTQKISYCIVPFMRCPDPQRESRFAVCTGEGKGGV